MALAKAFTPGMERSKEDVLNIAFWGRQLVSIALGVAFGLLPLTGVLGLGTYAVLSGVSMVFYCSAFLRTDMDEVGGAGEIAKEGFMSALGTFIIVWTTVYTAVHAKME